MPQTPLPGDIFDEANDGTRDPSTIPGLVGFWRFETDDRARDEGLADGEAQDGHYRDDATAIDGQLVTDGWCDRVDVRGADDPFDIDNGQINLRFTPTAGPACFPATILSRGEFADRGHEGYFEISVTSAGTVEILHCSGSADLRLMTPNHFWTPGDTLSVAYAWDVTHGATYSVVNETQGTSHDVSVEITGLTLEIGDNDDEQFVIAAREADDGHYSNYFDGTVDYVAVVDRAIPGLDGFVDGTEGDDLIDLAYTGDPEGDRIDAEDAILPGAAPNDDFVLAGAGDDTILAMTGDDSVEGGSGNEFAFGGSGDDTLRGEAGDDILVGGGGGDLVDGGSGNDTVFGDGSNPEETLVTLTFQGEEAAFKNIIGVYSVDPETGLFTDVRIIFPNASQIGSGGMLRPGDAVSFPVEAGVALGVFLVADGASKIDVSMLGEGSYAFETEEGDPAGLDSASPQLIFEAPGGGETTIPGPIYHSTAFGDSLALNPDGLVHTLALGGPRFAFEDLPNLGDADFDDAILDLDLAGSTATFDIPGLSLAGDGTDVPVPGADTLLGGDGDDLLVANGENDLLKGGTGNDQLLGGEGDDTLKGGAGDDTLLGGEGRDSLLGGEGADVALAVGIGDVVSGGAGGADEEDVLVIDGPALIEFDPADPTSGVIRYIDVNGTILGEAEFEGIEELVFVPPVSQPGRPTPDEALVLSARIGGPDGIVDGTDGDDLIDLNYTGDPDGDRIDNEDAILPGEKPNDDIVKAGDGNDIVEGVEQDDDVFGGNGDDQLFGNDGNDILRGEDGDDTLDGGAGQDLLSGGDGADSLIGGAEDDILEGLEGEDTLEGGTGDDFLVGGDDNDLLNAGAGGDIVLGGDGDDTIDAGGDDVRDFILGDDDADSIIGVGVGDIIRGGDGGNDQDTLDLRNSGQTFEIRIDGPDSDGNGFDGRIIYKNPDGTDRGTAVFENIETIIPCFTPGMLIATPKGPVPAEDLRPGDRVLTRDNGSQTICWAGTRELEAAEIAAAPKFAPVVIKADALGPGMPAQDIAVSPNHRVLLSGPVAELLFEEPEVLVAAKHLVGKSGIERGPVADTAYVHFMFERHEIVLSHGLWSESFQPGDMALAGIDDAQRAEIFQLFPDLAVAGGRAAYGTARPALKAFEARLL